MSGGRSGPLLPVALGLVLGVAVLAVYRFGAHAAWHLDDGLNIVQRLAVHIGSLRIEGLWIAARDGFLDRRPLPYVTFALDWWRGGGTPGPFVQTNLVIHLVAAMLVFTLALQCCGRVLAAWVAALWWAVQPVHMSAVAYVSQRFTSLSALFVLAAVVVWIAARRDRSQEFEPPSRWRWPALTGVAILMGVLASITKEPGLLVVPLVALAEYLVCRSRGAARWSGAIDRWVLGGMAAGALLIAADLLAGGPVRQVLDATFAARYDFGMAEQLLTQPRALLFYASLAAWPDPARFSLLHDFPVSRGWLSPPATLAAWAFALAWIGAGAALAWRGRRAAAFAMLWVAVAASMENSVLPIEPVYEYRFYLPSVGLALLMAVLAAGAGPRARAVLLVVVLAWTAAAAAATWQRAPLWGSTATIADEMVKHAPANPLARIALATARHDARDFVAAERMFRELIAMPRLGGEPRHRHEVQNGLGEALFAQQRFVEAREAFAHAIEFAPGEPIYRWNLALTLERLRDCGGARAEWRAFLRHARDARDREQVTEHLRAVHGPGGACAR